MSADRPTIQQGDAAVLAQQPKYSASALLLLLQARYVALCLLPHHIDGYQQTAVRHWLRCTCRLLCAGCCADVGPDHRCPAAAWCEADDDDELLVVLGDVPAEVVRGILQALDPLSLAAAACVCR